MDPYLKHVWEEIFFNYEDAWIGQALVLPAGYVEAGAWFGTGSNISSDPEMWRQNFWYEIDPNPPWEEKVLLFDVGPGGFAFIDRFHIATECIPEPGSLAIWFVLGAVGVAATCWRLRRKAA